MICLSSKREKGLWTRVGLNSPPVSTKGHTPVGFGGGGASEYWSMFGYKKGVPATWEPWEKNLHGGHPSLGCLCLTPFA